jgi:cell wall-associated NlpC family hydrolase
MSAARSPRAPRLVALGAGGLVLAGVLMAAATGVVSASLGGAGGDGMVGGVGGADGGTPASATIAIEPTATASSRIPAGMLVLFETAAATCPGLPWTVLAAIGTVESGNGTSNLPGVHSGANGAGAEGPMQFEPATFAAYDQPVPAGGADPPSPYDPTDAVYAAARMLCADGAANGADAAAAVYSYNHSARYVAEVLSLAQSYGQAAPAAAAASPAATAIVTAGATAGEVAVAWALAQVGTPYVWGGETPGVGFDCSGLTQVAYRVAGIDLPRVAQDQFDGGPRLGLGAELEPGDLVFFGDGPSGVTHVGLYVGVRDARAMMVDAPHTGADVRVEAFPTTIGASWGTDVVVGFTRPEV